jgi:putative DNA primase/helicase
MDETTANIGLRGGLFVAVDVDVYDEQLAGELAERVSAAFPGAPVRVGQRPKRLLLLRLEEGSEPFRKRSLKFEFGGRQHGIEVLAEGQHFVISGTHPSGVMYEWPQGLPRADQLPTCTEDQLDELLARIKEELESRGIQCNVQKGGSGASRVSVNQESLKARNLDKFAEAARLLPNDYPDRIDYIRIGAAIKAACQDDPIRGFDLFMEWAEKWEGGNDPETVAKDWEGLKPPYGIGARYIFGLARDYGFEEEDAVDEFDALEVPSPDPPKRCGESVLTSLLKPDLINDIGNAERFVALHGEDCRFLPDRKFWRVWDGSKWVEDQTREVERRAEQTMREFYAVASEVKAYRKFVRQSQNLHRIRAQLKLAEARLAKPSCEFDDRQQAQFLINFRNGTFDLRTGELRQHRRDDFITAVARCKYNPRAECPNFLALMGHVTGGSAAFADYLQLSVGYSISGSVVCKALFILYGPSGTAKTTFLIAVTFPFGEYSTFIRSESLMRRLHADDANTLSDLSDLEGKRFAMTSETEEGQVFSEATLKRLTQGTGFIKTVRKYENHRTFPETHKLWIDANHRPTIRSTVGVYERIHVIPFQNVIPEQERRPNIREVLESEAEGIAAWVIAGALKWYRGGMKLPKPSEVETAINDYRDSQGIVDKWLSEEFDRDPEGYVRAHEAQASYHRFCL